MVSIAAITYYHQHNNVKLQKFICLAVLRIRNQTKPVSQWAKIKVLAELCSCLDSRGELISLFFQILRVLNSLTCAPLPPSSKPVMLLLSPPYVSFHWSSCCYISHPGQENSPFWKIHVIILEAPISIRCQLSFHLWNFKNYGSPMC